MSAPRPILASLFCLYSLAAISQTKWHLPVDTSMYTVLPYDSTIEMVMWEKFDHPTPTTLSATEVSDLEPMIDSAYWKYNRAHAKRPLTKPLTFYKRQYVAVINGDGQKEVWIFLICWTPQSAEWRQHVLEVDDGDTCFLQLRINLTTGKIGELIPNGIA